LGQVETWGVGPDMTQAPGSVVIWFLYHRVADAQAKSLKCWWERWERRSLVLYGFEKIFLEILPGLWGKNWWASETASGH
jgi:hypothetical protein